MKNKKLEIGSAVYTGICIYNRLRKSIIQIEGEFVHLEDKIELGLYLGILHSQNSISKLLRETELVSNTKIDYNKLTSREFCELYDLYFKNIMNNINRETIDEYFKALLEKEIVIKLNKENNFNANEFFDFGNKKLIKK